MRAPRVLLPSAPRHPSCGSTAEPELKEYRISDPRTNDRIRVPEVRLVGPAGEQVGVVTIEVALRLAQEADLDLVEVAPNSKPPVVKIMDYGKFKYEEAQKAKEARRNQANTILKEVRFRLKIDKHDYETKRKRAEGFLADGDKVKAMILFRGREQSRPEMGARLLARFAEDVAEFGSVESSPMIDGRNMVMVIGPHKNKATAKAEADARKAAASKATAARNSARGGARTAADVDEAETVAVTEVAAEVANAFEKPVVATKTVEKLIEPESAVVPVEVVLEQVVDIELPAEPAEKPAAEKPAAVKPAAARPAAARPAASKPAAAKPTPKPLTTPANAPRPPAPRPAASAAPTPATPTPAPKPATPSS
jgi:translation initiation factor IF-3